MADDESVSTDAAIDGTKTPKPKRGRPKAPWEPFEDELFRRLTSGEAAETVEAEAKYLHGWGKENGIRAMSHSGPISAPRIRERIKKRYEGSDGYKNTRAWHLAQLGRTKMQD